MVLESILNPKSAENKPFFLFFISFLYTAIAFLIANSMFGVEASLVSVFLIVVAGIPLFYNTVLYEEKKDEIYLSEKRLIKEHFKAFSFFMYFFLGITMAYMFFYIALPSEQTTQLFTAQLSTITSINGNLTSDRILLNNFKDILFNNLKVLALCILFAFLYGSGAIFILTWNASVVGVALGNLVKQILSKLGVSYFHAISLGLLRYSIHGIPEILAYFVAGLSGSLISYASIKYHFNTKNYANILSDASILIVLSVVLLFFAAFLEVFVTGFLF